MEAKSIRPMQIEDLKAVLAIEHLSFSLPWSFESFIAELKDNDYARYFCLIVDGHVVGYMGLWDILNEGHITNIAVSPEYRCRGLGEFLIDSVMRNMSGKGMKRMTLEVRISNLAARQLYEKLGFVIVGVRKGYYSDNREDALIMWAELNNKKNQSSGSDR